jgi:hypothetical protein
MGETAGWKSFGAATFHKPDSGLRFPLNDPISYKRRLAIPRRPHSKALRPDCLSLPDCDCDTVS